MLCNCRHIALVVKDKILTKYWVFYLVTDKVTWTAADWRINNFFTLTLADFCDDRLNCMTSESITYVSMCKVNDSEQVYVGVYKRNKKSSIPAGLLWRALTTVPTLPVRSSLGRG